MKELFSEILSLIYWWRGRGTWRWRGAWRWGGAWLCRWVGPWRWWRPWRSLLAHLGRQRLAAVGADADRAAVAGDAVLDPRRVGAMGADDHDLAGQDRLGDGGGGGPLGGRAGGGGGGAG